MPHRLMLCENCGAKLQIARNWGRMVVCGSCYAALSAPKPPEEGRQRPRVWPAVLIAVLFTTAVTIFEVRQSPKGERAVAPGHFPPGPPLASAPDGQAPPDFTELEPSGRRSMATTAASQSAATQPATSAAGAITGVVFLTRGRSARAPLRALRLQLLRPTIKREAVQTCLAIEAREWRALADDYTTQAQDARDEMNRMQRDSEADPDAAADADVTDAQDRAEESQEIADEATAAMRRVQSAIEAVPAEVDAATALRGLAQLALLNLPSFSDAVSDATISEVRTDSDGAYEFTGVPPGDYYLHAASGTGSSFIEWCVPVHVEGQTVTVDLSRDNASVVPTTN